MSFWLCTKITCVSTHSRPKAAAIISPTKFIIPFVSTHSRPKAAAAIMLFIIMVIKQFQHTAARRRLPYYALHNSAFAKVSTHSRPKAAASGCAGTYSFGFCFNTQPPEGGCVATFSIVPKCFSFNTQPPEGGCYTRIPYRNKIAEFQHTAARRRLRPRVMVGRPQQKFQHTAARRRLHKRTSYRGCFTTVSTHSRPKAAANIKQ